MGGGVAVGVGAAVAGGVTVGCGSVADVGSAVGCGAAVGVGAGDGVEVGIGVLVGVGVAAGTGVAAGDGIEAGGVGGVVVGVMVGATSTRGACFVVETTAGGTGATVVGAAGGTGGSGSSPQPVSARRMAPGIRNASQNLPAVAKLKFITLAYLKQTFGANVGTTVGSPRLDHACLCSCTLFVMADQDF